MGLVGRPGRRRPGVVTGSHLDSVPDGGAFDGPLGVVSAFAALDRLRADGFAPRRPLGVVNFADEEGARFGVACAGSRVITGALTPDRALGAARRRRGHHGRGAARGRPGPGADSGRTRRPCAGSAPSSSCTSSRAAGWSTSTSRSRLGTDIWPHGRWRLDFPGEANHAGTTRLADRRDAMLGLATTVLAARSAAAAHGCVATVGKP